jgi:hypothetical protein
MLNRYRRDAESIAELNLGWCERMRTEAFRMVTSVRWVRLPAIGEGCRPFAGQKRPSLARGCMAP